MASKASLENTMRNEILEVIIQALSEHFDLDPETQIEAVSSGAIVLPLVDAEGNEKYPKVTVTIPRGTRNGAGGYIPFDGHQMALLYQEEQEIKAQKHAKKKDKEKEEVSES